MDADDLCPSRRSVLRSLATFGGVVLVPGVLVACSSDEEPDGGGSGDTGGTSGTSPSAGASVPASEVGVGQARVVDAGGQRVVVAQPAEGEFVAFSSTCTHEGTTVQAGEGLTLTCPNHGSQFDAADGSVVNGPATRSLPTVPVALEGDQLVLSP